MKLNDAFKAIALLLLAIMVIPLSLVFMGAIPAPWTITPTTTTPPVTAPPEKYSINCLTKFTLKDLWAGGGIAGATVTIYNTKLEEVNTPTDSGAGIYTSTVAFRSGDTYYIKAVSGNAMIFYKTTIPFEDTNTVTYHYITLDFYTIGTYAISMQMPNGTSVNDGSTYNVTEAGVTYPTFTLMIRNTKGSDSGIMNYLDPYKNAQREVMFYFSIKGNQYEQCIPMGTFVNQICETSTMRYYGKVIEPNDLVVDKKADGTYNQYSGGDMDGIVTINIQFDTSGMAAGDGPEIAFYLYGFTNFARFSSFKTHYSDSLSMDAIGFDFKIVK